VEDLLQLPLVLVGPGRAGKAFARSWVGAGGALAGIVGKTASSAEREARELSTSGRTLETIWAECDLLVLAVPDDRIAGVAEELSARTRCRFAFHLSGALPAAALAPLSRAGAAVGSLHPLRAFTGGPSDSWHGALVAIEGDPAAVEAGERMTAALGGAGYRISAADKPLYHAAATLAAGGTMALLSIAVRAATAAGVPEEKARPALAQLAAEAATATAMRPFPEAFTGPIARRDAETVRAHRRASAGRADFSDLYRRLAEEILDTTSGRGREEAIRAILRDTRDRKPRRKPSARRP
jgi:predicted short-subunit dehydrogenase-like oxidoreductase (DUF2520 family)